MAELRRSGAGASSFSSAIESVSREEAGRTNGSRKLSLETLLVNAELAGFVDALENDLDISGPGTEVLLAGFAVDLLDGVDIDCPMRELPSSCLVDGKKVFIDAWRTGAPGLPIWLVDWSLFLSLAVLPRPKASDNVGRIPGVFGLFVPASGCGGRAGVFGLFDPAADTPLLFSPRSRDGATEEARSLTGLEGLDFGPGVVALAFELAVGAANENADRGKVEDES